MCATYIHISRIGSLTRPVAPTFWWRLQVHLYSFLDDFIFICSTCILLILFYSVYFFYYYFFISLLCFWPGSFLFLQLFILCVYVFFLNETGRCMKRHWRVSSRARARTQMYVCLLIRLSACSTTYRVFYIHRKSLFHIIHQWTK